MVSGWTHCSCSWSLDWTSIKSPYWRLISSDSCRCALSSYHLLCCVASSFYFSLSIFSGAFDSAGRAFFLGSCLKVGLVLQGARSLLGLFLRRPFVFAFSVLEVAMPSFDMTFAHAKSTSQLYSTSLMQEQLITSVRPIWIRCDALDALHSINRSDTRVSCPMMTACS